MDLGLNDAVVLVVGGSGYIGSEIARQFSAEGAQVVLAARGEEKLAQVAASVGGKVATRVMDTASEDSVATALASVVGEYGHLDVVILSAAPAAQTLDPNRSSDPDQVMKAFEGKSMGYLRVAVAALPSLVGQGFGRIIFINGQNALITGSVAATVRNGAVQAIAKNLADSAAASGVTVNVVNPGVVSQAGGPAPQRGGVGGTTPEQVAATVVFLASRPAAGISGESITIGHRLLGIMSF